MSREQAVPCKYARRGEKRHTTYNDDRICYLCQIRLLDLAAATRDPGETNRSRRAPSDLVSERQGEPAPLVRAPHGPPTPHA